jgi:hypothetical protein
MVGQAGVVFDAVPANTGTDTAKNPKTPTGGTQCRVVDGADVGNRGSICNWSRKHDPNEFPLKCDCLLGEVSAPRDSSGCSSGGGGGVQRPSKKRRKRAQRLAQGEGATQRPGGHQEGFPARQRPGPEERQERAIPRRETAATRQEIQRQKSAKGPRKRKEPPESEESVQREEASAQRR